MEGMMFFDKSYILQMHEFATRLKIPDRSLPHFYTNTKRIVREMMTDGTKKK